MFEYVSCVIKGTRTTLQHRTTKYVGTERQLVIQQGAYDKTNPSSIDNEGPYTVEISISL